MLPLYDETQTERGEQLLAQALDHAPPYDPLLRAAASSNAAGALSPSSSPFPTHGLLALTLVFPCDLDTHTRPLPSCPTLPGLSTLAPPTDSPEALRHQDSQGGQALVLVNKALRLYPTHLPSLVTAARVRMARREHPQAERILHTAYLLNPAFQDVEEELAHVRTMCAASSSQEVLPPAGKSPVRGGALGRKRPRALDLSV